ncbi:DUF2306 domain-containing protein [Brevundimonas sp.]|uniref:DUF2306 domain-containing protein n=1 Tax=Brevundimonas sp. TaxID=1871086 RepID=UPI0025C0E3F8|nr:DUF2306 domain-containing protein [Brevundimonas sp.]
MQRVATTTLFGLLALMCLAVALFSARFLLPSPVMAESMATHLQARPIIFLAHVAGGVTALALGAFQLVTWRGPRRAWHRMAGRVYVVACLVGALAGLGLALTTSAGPLAGLGFGLLAVVWLATTTLAWRKAVAGDFAQHRRWMIRSLALTFAAVTLRIMIPLSMMNGLDFAIAYPAIAFLCWVPNLIVIELWLRLWGWDATPPAPRARSGYTG